MEVSHQLVPLLIWPSQTCAGASGRGWSALASMSLSLTGLAVLAGVEQYLSQLQRTETSPMTQLLHGPCIVRTLR